MVHILTIRSLHEYIEINPNVGDRLKAWIALVKSCNWEKPQDIVNAFGAKAVDILTKSCSRVVIDIKGNHIRIIAKYQFHPTLKMARLYIKWIGTHAEYDEICKRNLQYEIEMFK